VFIASFLIVVLGIIDFSMEFVMVKEIWVINLGLSLVVLIGSGLLILVTPGLQMTEISEFPQSYEPKKFCIVCSVNRKKGTKHCYSCDLCILDRLCHLPILDKCIGKNTKYILYIVGSSLISYFSIFLFSIIYSSL
jgi:Uncharacterized protein containing DHHC-type Zn finger